MITNPPIPPQVNEKNKLDKSDKKISLDPPKQKDLSVEEEYIVTLKRKSDLISFYEDMETLGGTSNVPDREVELFDRRPISRNTHYLLTGYEVEELKKDERVLDIELAEVIRNLKIEFNSSYQVSETFDKTPESVNDIPWSILHCAGDQNQRRKGVFGEGVTEEVTDTVSIFNDGENVDLIIMDDPVPYDHQEFLDPDTNQSRVVQYQWFSELNQYMVGLDTQESDSAWQDFVDATTSTPTPYYTCAEISSYGFSSHGSSMAGLAAGKTMGFARKSNIYSMDVLSSQQQIDFFIAFDYVRAFHLNKKNNSGNGKYNPTVVNCSFQVTREMAYINNFSLISQIIHQGVTYNNPNNGTWEPIWETDAQGYYTGVLNLGYLEQNFGLSNSEIGTQYFSELEGSLYYLALPKKYSAIDVDVEDAIEEGVIVICAAGNSGEYNASSEDSNYDNEIKFYSSNADWGVSKFLYTADLIFPSISGVYSFDNFYHRGISPRSAENAITVGAISNKADFRKGYFSSYGSKLDFLSPGENLISSDIGTTSNYSIGSGTSQASAVASGIATVFCTNKDSGEVNNSRFLDYVKTYGNSGEMDGNLSGGGYADNTSMLNTENLGVSVKNRRTSANHLSFNDTVKKDSGMIYPRKRNKITSSVYSLSSSVDPVSEGGSVTLTLETIDVDEGTVIPFTISGTNIDTNDFVGLDSLGAGEFTIDDNGDADYTLTINNDETTENLESFTVTLDGIGESTSVDISDTSTTPVANEPVLNISGASPAPNSVNVNELIYGPSSPISIRFSSVHEDGTLTINQSLIGVIEDDNTNVKTGDAYINYLNENNIFLEIPFSSAAEKTYEVIVGIGALSDGSLQNSGGYSYTFNTISTPSEVEPTLNVNDVTYNNPSTFNPGGSSPSTTLVKIDINSMGHYQWPLTIDQNYIFANSNQQNPTDPSTSIKNGNAYIDGTDLVIPVTGLQQGVTYVIVVDPGALKDGSTSNTQQYTLGFQPLN